MAYGPFNAGAGKGGGGSAADTSYDNSTSGIEASNVQDALDTVLGATLPRLTVKVAAGSAITITDGTSTITGTANTAGSFTPNRHLERERDAERREHRRQRKCGLSRWQLHHRARLLRGYADRLREGRHGRHRELQRHHL